MFLVDWLIYNRRDLMIQEARSTAREYQSLSRNIATTTRTMRPVPRLLRLTLTRQSQDRGDWTLMYLNMEMISSGVFQEINVSFLRLKTRRDSIRQQWIIITTTTLHLRQQRAFVETLVLDQVILVWCHRAIWLIRCRLRPRCVPIVRRDSVLIKRSCRLKRLWRLEVALAAWGWSNRNKKNALLVLMIVSFLKNGWILDTIIRKKRHFRP